jgi:hypothetical protein
LATSSALAVVGVARVAAAAPPADPSAFLTRTIGLIAANRYAEAWAALNPAHKQVAPRGEYVGCERLTPVPGRLQSIRITNVRDEELSLGGATVAAKSAAAHLVIAGGGEPVVIDTTVHAVEVDGRWTWVLPEERFEAYSADRCLGYPDETPPWRRS